MNVKYLPFQTTVDRLCGTPNNRARVIAVALAVALAADAALPTGPVDNSSTFYSTQVEPQLVMILGQLNENLVFDVRVALDYCRRQWLIRYNAAHPLGFAQFPGAGCNFYECLFGAHIYAAGDDLAFVNANAGPILQLAVMARELIAACK